MTRKPMAALLTVSDLDSSRSSLAELQANDAVGDIAAAHAPDVEVPPGCTSIVVNRMWSSDSVRSIVAWLETTGAEHLLWVFAGPTAIDVKRLRCCAVDAGAVLTYSDYIDVDHDNQSPHPLIDYQPGSLRDDFDFGGVVVLRADTLGSVQRADDLSFGGWYDLRLRLSEAGRFLHIPEPLYALPTLDARKSGEKVFDYVDPRKRDYQIEMEQVATSHLRRIDAWLPPPTGKPVDDDRLYVTAASVIIPVKNRQKTVGEAVRSALAQETEFQFNVIVVDNHSEDGTTEVLAAMAAEDLRLVHLVPRRRDLGIGGCWQHAIESEQCGRYAVQLDSDDAYNGTNVLARIVAELDKGCAMVIGSYSTVSFDLEPLPPGLVDHREWSDDNGHNNALRIAGLGAPRAFHVPTLRQIGFPNVSYGEDYAVALRMCRDYRLGRIYDSLYWCRRWQGNSDSALPLATSNRYHLYKDRLRTIELWARQRQNRS